MPTLRDHTRTALAASEPDDREARELLDAIRRRARRRRVSPAWLVPPALAAMAAFAFFVGARPPRAPERVAPSPRGVHLYLRASNETEAHAIHLDLETRGEH
jgi:hypothetical protein